MFSEHVFSQDLFMQLGGLETVVQALLVARDCAILEGEDFKSDSETESKDGEDSEDETSWVSVAVGLLVTLNYALQGESWYCYLSADFPSLIFASFFFSLSLYSISQTTHR